MPLPEVSYLQIHLREREKIEQLYSKGYTAGRIAGELGRSRSTVTREIQRNGYKKTDGTWGYKAYMAQALYAERQRKVFRNKKMPAQVPSGRITPDYYQRRVYRRPLRLKYSAARWRSKYRSRRRFGTLSDWHESRYAQRWRKKYNHRRIRHYRWEEIGRCDFYKRRRLSFILYRNNIEEYRSFTWRRAYTKYRKQDQEYHKSKSLQRLRNHEGYGILWLHPKHAIKPLPLSSLLPAARKPVPSSCPVLTAASKAKGRSMSASGLKGLFFKIPSVIQQGSPCLFLKSA